MNKLVKLVLVGEEEVEIVRHMVKIEQDIRSDRIARYSRTLDEEKCDDMRKETLCRLMAEDAIAENLCEKLLKQLGA